MIFFFQVVAWYESQQAQAIIFDMFLFFLLKILGSSQIMHLNHLRFQFFFKMFFMFLVARSRYDMLIHVDSLYKSI